MRGGWIAGAVLLLSACRLGFDEVTVGGDDGGEDGVVVTPPVPGVAHVVVLGEDGEAGVGQPVANAYVVAIEQDGTTTTVRTAADGTADIAVLGNTALHVARPIGAQDWALSSFRAVNDGAQIVAGGRPPIAKATTRSVNVTLADFPVGYSEVWVTGPRQCLPDSAYATSTNVAVAYDAQCEGQTVELFALSYDIFVPIGTVTLADGSAVDRSALAWSMLDKLDIDYTNIPADVTNTYAFVAWPTAAGDLIPMSERGAMPDTDGFVGLAFDLPPIVPGTSMVHVFESPSGVRVHHERFDAWPGTRQFDASLLPPSPPTPTLDTSVAQVQWTAGAGADADLYWSSVDIQLDPTRALHWNAFGPPTATQVTFPALPAELQSIVPTGIAAWSPPCIVLAALSDFDYASALQLVDRDIFWWWSQGAYMPPGTVSLTATSTPP